MEQRTSSGLHAPGPRSGVEAGTAVTARPSSRVADLVVAILTQIVEIRRTKLVVDVNGERWAVPAGMVKVLGEQAAAPPRSVGG